MSQPRIRTIKPEMWTSRDFRALSNLGRLCFIALISHADDHGRLKTDPGHISETMLMGTPPDDIDQQLGLMEGRGMVRRYGPSDHFLAVLNWRLHQHVDKPKDSTLPEPPKFKRRVNHGSQLVLEVQPNRSENKDSVQPNKGSAELEIVATDREGSLSTRAHPNRSGTDQEPNRSGTDHVSRALALGQAAAIVKGLASSLAEWNARRQSSPSRDFEEADRLLRIDKRPLAEALEVLAWATHDDFWRPNIRSISKFRKQYDTLRGQMERRPPALRKSALELSIEGDLQAASRRRMEGQ